MLGTEQLFHIKKPIIAMLHPDALKMLCFINPESDRNPDTRLLHQCQRRRSGCDALIASVKQAAPEAAVLCNTGCRPDTIARKLP